MYELLFFFSSRRRHTRCSRDWSSDVCSSDLAVPASQRDGQPASRGRDLAPPVGRPPRSEERRVGKECRCRWARSSRKKKKTVSFCGVAYARRQRTSSYANALTTEYVCNRTHA